MAPGCVLGWSVRLTLSGSPACCWPPSPLC